MSGLWSSLVPDHPTPILQFSTSDLGYISPRCPVRVTWEVGNMVKALGFCFNEVFSWSLLGVCVALRAGWLDPYVSPRVKRQKWPGLLQTQAWSDHDDFFRGCCERIRLSPRCEVLCSGATSQTAPARGIEASGCS